MIAVSLCVEVRLKITSYPQPNNGWILETFMTEKGKGLQALEGIGTPQEDHIVNQPGRFGVPRD